MPAQCPHVDSITNSRHHTQPSPTAPNDHGMPQHRKNNNTTPRHAANERRPGATSPTNNSVDLHPPPPTLFLRTAAATHLSPHTPNDYGTPQHRTTAMSPPQE
ncbi:hypothetical protein K443DRAFT_10937 [Laccaria amethystina LaAM-08-1]|uniref:Uncharacterized protein n=1 Tax=Laccaria amethystina LaAM-08-1 TaxID=1095629 RepID=A0A0C9XEC2_9AGAR|nr:hypothetical protein K443DRAFT_10937 [Laccaria amethystina LaAM-08-1]